MVQNYPVLTLPGWQGSGPTHWQSRWEERYGDRRVEQHEWMSPLRGDWMARLEEVLLEQTEPVFLAAHSLGCLLVANWAEHSVNIQRVAGALLVAPPDAQQQDWPVSLRSWTQIPAKPLPFPAFVVASRDDHYCRLERAKGFANQWRARFIDCGARGHINGDSGLGDWPEGRAWLQELSFEVSKGK